MLNKFMIRRIIVLTIKYHIVDYNYLYFDCIDIYYNFNINFSYINELG